MVSPARPTLARDPYLRRNLCMIWISDEDTGIEVRMVAK
jgi:hypothetical protein